MRVKNVKDSLKAVGMSITWRDGEYRVTFDASWNMTSAKREDAAYYTSDLHDAHATGIWMAGSQRSIEDAKASLWGE